MLASNRSALKEWASVERALGAGAVTLLLRKGGIHEQRGDFAVEHREFWLFPTVFHQSPDELLPGFRPLLDAPFDRNVLPVRHYAEVADARRVENLEALQRLAGMHPLTNDSVRARFAYRGKHFLHALLLRVHRLPEPHQVANTLSYEGCVSWVELDDELGTAGSVPVLAEAEFEARRLEILSRLGNEGVFRV